MASALQRDSTPSEALGSVNVVPEVLEESGFQFQDEDVDDVIAAALKKP